MLQVCGAPNYPSPDSFLSLDAIAAGQGPTVTDAFDLQQSITVRGCGGGGASEADEQRCGKLHAFPKNDLDPIVMPPLNTVLCGTGP